LDPFIKRIVLKKQGGFSAESEDYIATEKKLRVSVDGKELLSLYCTPLMVRELIVGFFLTEGVISGDFCLDTISIRFGEEDITVDIPAGKEVETKGATITSGCVGGITFNRKNAFEKITDSLSVKATVIENVFREFQQKGELYRLTGCIHSAALANENKILIFAEDIGRHNAVDKVIGHCIIEDIPFNGKLLLVSGRLSSEIASKCARWGIPIVASRTAPTELAIKIAEASGVTLVGFVRSERMNIYTQTQRIII
jgi:FdhD protein